MKTEDRGSSDERRDVAILGLILLSVGCGLIAIPLGLIVPGSVLLTAAAWPYIRSTK